MSEVQTAEVVQTTTRVAMGALRGKNYAKTNGSVSCGDEVAVALAGAKFEALVEFAKTVGIDTSKYDHLNPGQKRMNIGNKLRTLVRKGELSVAELAAIERAPVPEKKVTAAAPAPAADAE